MAHQFLANEHDYNKTLYQVAEQGLAVKFKCTQCGAAHELDVLELIKAHGGETRLRYVQRTSKCNFCP